jgi:hypothetical protein
VDSQRHARDTTERIGVIVGLRVELRLRVGLLERQRLRQRQVQWIVHVEFGIELRVQFRQFVGLLERERQRLWAARFRLGLRQRSAVRGAR